MNKKYFIVINRWFFSIELIESESRQCHNVWINDPVGATVYIKRKYWVQGSSGNLCVEFDFYKSVDFNHLADPFK